MSPWKRNSNRKSYWDCRPISRNPMVPDTDQRLEHYRRLSSIREPEEVEDVAVEMGDRYGQPPLGSRESAFDNGVEVLVEEGPCQKDGDGRVIGLTLTFIESGPVNLDKVLDIVKSRPRGGGFIARRATFFCRKKGLNGPKRHSNCKKSLARVDIKEYY